MFYVVEGRIKVEEWKLQGGGCQDKLRKSYLIVELVVVGGVEFIVIEGGSRGWVSVIEVVVEGVFDYIFVVVRLFFF